MLTLKKKCDCIEAFMTDLDADNSSVCTLKDARVCTKPYAPQMSIDSRPCKEDCSVPCNATIYNPVYSFSTLAFVQVRVTGGNRGGTYALDASGTANE